MARPGKVRAHLLRDMRDYWLAYPAGRLRSPEIRACRDGILAQAAQELERTGPEIASALPASAAGA